MGYNKWIDSKLASQGTTIVKFISDACDVIEKAIPGAGITWTHKMGPWFAAPAYDRLERHCPCGYKQYLTGQQLSFATSNAKLAALVASVYEGDPYMGKCPVVFLESGSPPPGFYSTAKALDQLMEHHIVEHESLWKIYDNTEPAVLTEQVLKDAFQTLAQNETTPMPNAS